jgi:pimeloyl-ACP methyl ester carboxylesterase
MHPRLLKSLILLDPVIQLPDRNSFGPAISSTFRRDAWPSREVARQKFTSNKFYQAWDPRVLDLWIEHGLRSIPTAIVPSQGADDRRVTLTTTKHQEVTLYLRPLLFRVDENDTPGAERKLPVDFDTKLNEDYHSNPFYRPEPAHIFKRLPELRPNVLYIHGEHSTYCNKDQREGQIAMSGAGVGGGGGVVNGQVEHVLLRECGHLLPFEKVEESAESISGFLNRQVEIWKKEQKEFHNRWVAKSKVARATVDRRWLAGIDPGRQKKEDMDRCKASL